MPNYVTVVTPENVRIEYELAGIASRAAAVLVDSIIQALIMGSVALLWFGVIYGFSLPTTGWLTAILVLIEFLIYWGYYIYFETKWNGQTPGKRALRLRAVREGGLPIDITCACLRNLIRLIDITIVGLISILVTRKNQRLGDIAAGTLVVKERLEWTGDLVAQTTTPEVAQERSTDYVRNIELVTCEEFEAAKRFLSRKAELRDDVCEELAARIAKPLMTRLGMDDVTCVVYSEVLADVHRLCVEERGMR